MSPARLGPATSPDLGRRRHLLLVPLGSTEQHGPHLPLDTDSRIATAWAEALAERVPGAVVAPALPYGSSGEHQAFAGTLSIGQAALESVLVELARSAAHSFEATVLVCGHAGNLEPVDRAVALLRRGGHAITALFPTWDPGEPGIGPVDAHAGRVETSLMLHLAPDLVRIERAEAGNAEPVASLLDRLRAGGVAAVAANGVLGDPAGASAAEGAALLAALVERSVDRLAAVTAPPGRRPDGS